MTMVQAFVGPVEGYVILAFTQPVGSLQLKPIQAAKLAEELISAATEARTIPAFAEPSTKPQGSCLVEKRKQRCKK